MLGLGLGLSKGTNLLSNLKLLTRNADFAFWGDKATGTSKGLNSPATNPIQDLVGNADGTLQGFAFTSASGYVDVVAPNGKTVTGIQGDGVNDVIVLPSNAPNPVGLQDFGFAFVFKTANTLTSSKVLYCRNTSGPIPTDAQFAVNTDGSSQISISLNGTLKHAGVVIPNTFYKLIVKRTNGKLTIILNGTTVYDIANVEIIVQKNNSRLFARSSIADGTLHSLFGDHTLFYADYNNGDNIDAWEVDQNKGILKAFGL